MTDGFDRFVRFAKSWSAITDAELAPARALFRPAFAAKGEFLARAGEPARGSAFILRGLVRQHFTGADGRERVHGFRAEDELVCAYRAALRGEVSDLFIQALEPTWYLAIPQETFAQLVLDHRGWADLSARLTEHKFVQGERRTRELLLDDATTRYVAFAAEEPELVGRLALGQIAAYVGITPEALSRIRRKLATEATEATKATKATKTTEPAIRPRAKAFASSFGN